MAEDALPALLAVLGAAALLLTIAMLSITFIARRLHFSRADEIAIVFCGSKKSLPTGVPMAKVMFAGGGLARSCCRSCCITSCS